VISAPIVSCLSHVGYTICALRAGLDGIETRAPIFDRVYYFNSLLPTYGGNSRLLQAKDLLTLDRWASLNRTENAAAVLNGLRIELKYDQHIVLTWTSILQNSLNGADVAWPIRRFKTDAVSTYIMQPILRNYLDAGEILEYWELSNICNKIFDVLSPGVFAPKNKNEVLNDCLNHLKRLTTLTTSIQGSIRQAEQALGPLATI